nr:MAG TPA: hypothetical protein [Caudoviricetes sp.]
MLMNLTQGWKIVDYLKYFLFTPHPIAESC